MTIIKLETDTLRFTITTHVEYGNMHMKIEDPFERSISEIVSPNDVKKIITVLQQALTIQAYDE